MLLTVNLDIQDRLINDQTGNISHTEFAQGGASRLKGNEIIFFRKTKLLGSYEKSEAEIPIKKGATSPSVKFTQFPLILAWASTVHKIQVLSLKQGVADLICESKNHLGQGKHILLSVG